MKYKTLTITQLWKSQEQIYWKKKKKKWHIFLDAIKPVLRNVW